MQPLTTITELTVDGSFTLTWSKQSRELYFDEMVASFREAHERPCDNR